MTQMQKDKDIQNWSYRSTI